MKINNKRELQNIAFNHSIDINYKNFMEIYREYTKKPFNCLTIDTSLPPRNAILVRFRKSLIPFYENDSNWSDENFRQKNYVK